MPPVSAARVASVSCELLIEARCAFSAQPLKMPAPREAPLLAPPPGGSPIRPRASIGIDRDIRLHGGIDGGFQLRLVLDAGLADAAGNVDQRLLLGQRGQLAHRLFDRGQLAVGIEDVELGLIGDEGRAGILAVVVAGIGVRGHVARLADRQVLDDVVEHVAVGREIGLHLNRAW